MQDLASEFSQIFRRWYGLILTTGGATPSHTQHPAGPLAGRGALDPNFGPPQLFSRGCAPACYTEIGKISHSFRLAVFATVRKQFAAGENNEGVDNVCYNVDKIHLTLNITQHETSYNTTLKYDVTMNTFILKDTYVVPKFL